MFILNIVWNNVWNMACGGGGDKLLMSVVGILTVLGLAMVAFFLIF